MHYASLDPIRINACYVQEPSVGAFGRGAASRKHP